MDGGVELMRASLRFEAMPLWRSCSRTINISDSSPPRRFSNIRRSWNWCCSFPVLVSSVALPGERPRLDESLDLSGRLLCDQQGLSHLSAAPHRRDRLLAAESGVLSGADDLAHLSSYPTGERATVRTRGG